MPSLLLVDDDRSVRHQIRAAFHGQDLKILLARSEADGLSLVERREPDVVLMDFHRGPAGLQMYQRILALDPRLPVVFITSEGNSNTAIEAMKLGAVDILFKPLDVTKVKAVVSQSLEIRRLMAVPVSLPVRSAAPAVPAGEEHLVGNSPGMLDVYKGIGRVASHDVTVLIRGESGTGKELIARAIYHHSARQSKPFLAVNCAAMPDALLESELFGHEKGAFTGADQRRIGKFEQYSGGTILLDEVGDMSPLLQSKLLRLLAEQRFERVGGNETITTNVRVLTATHRDVEAMTEAGRFRADLFYRLNGFSIHLPPLRERGDDILLLIDSFLARYSRELGKVVERISPDALKLLVDYPWPGNVRELQSVLRKGLLNASGSVLVASFLPEGVRSTRPKRSAGKNDCPESDLATYFANRLQSRSENLYEEVHTFMESYVVTEALQLTSGNQSKAAEVLGITRGSLRNKIQALGIAIGHTVHIES